MNIKQKIEKMKMKMKMTTKEKAMYQSPFKER